MRDDLTIHDTLTKADTPNGSDILAGGADRYAVEPEVLENGRFGGKSQGGKFGRGEHFCDVFLLEKILVQVCFRSRNLNPLKDLAWRKNLFDRERQTTPICIFSHSKKPNKRCASYWPFDDGMIYQMKSQENLANLITSALFQVFAI